MMHYLTNLRFDQLLQLMYFAVAACTFSAFVAAAFRRRFALNWLLWTVGVVAVGLIVPTVFHLTTTLH